MSTTKRIDNVVDDDWSSVKHLLCQGSCRVESNRFLHSVDDIDFAKHCCGAIVNEHTADDENVVAVDKRSAILDGKGEEVTKDSPS